MDIHLSEIAAGFTNLARQKLGLLPPLMQKMGEKRYAICISNFCGNYIEADDKCHLCGCLMKAKVLSPRSMCPIALWNYEPLTVEIKDMKVLTAGHRYIVANHQVPSQGQVIQFIEKKPSEADPSVLEVVADGTTNEEVIEVLIDRLQYLNGKMESIENKYAIEYLGKALNLLKQRTADSVSRGVEGTDKV